MDYKRQLKRGLGRWLRRRRRRAEPALAHWPQLSVADGQLALCGQPLQALAEEHGTPLHVVDFAALQANVQALQVPVAAGQHTEFFCSYKTNPVPAVLQAMHAAGAGAEVISHFELWLALKLGVAPERIIYNGPVKSDASLQQAVAQGVAAINVNSLGELQRVKGIAQAVGRPANVGLRCSAEGGWTGQFGLDRGNGDFLRAITQMQQSGHLRPVALHVHRGVSIRDAGTLRAHVRAVLGIWSQLQREQQLRLPMVDFGGSLACPSVDWHSARAQRLARSFFVPPPAPDVAACLTPQEYASVVASTAREFCEAAQLALPRLVLEPGRGVTGNTQLLLARVMDRKPNPDQFEFLILDAGINLAESMRGEYHRIFRCRSPEAQASALYRIAGPICTPGDVLSWATALPPCEASELLAVMDAGAYFVPFSTSFSYPQPGIVGVHAGGRVQPLRRAESFEDIVARDSGY